MKILWFPGWYPNRIEQFAGDFIQRHANAVSQYHAIEVIYIVRDKAGVITKNYKEENVQRGNVKETIVYYHTPVIPVPFIDRMVSARRYLSLHKKIVTKYIKKEGVPFCAHVHIADKNGLAALWLKKKYKVPFFVSEHWTIYLEGALPNFVGKSWIFKKMWNKIMNASQGLSVVSNYLGNALVQIKKDIEFTVIPNVVNNNIFFPNSIKENNPISFVHISTLGYQKNPEAILHAFSVVKKTMPSFKLAIFGPHKLQLEELAKDLSLQEHVSFHHEIPQTELAVYLRNAHALILYSRYETFGCVLIEAHASGIPTIVSDIPVFYEIIEEGINGYFVAGENADALAEKIIWFMKEGNCTTSETIAAGARKRYNYERIGKQFSDFYRGGI